MFCTEERGCIPSCKCVKEKKAKRSNQQNKRQLTKFERSNRVGRKRRSAFALDGEAETRIRLDGSGVFGSFENEVL